MQEEKQQIQDKYDTHLKEKHLERLEKKVDKEPDEVVVFDLEAILPCLIGNASVLLHSKLNTFNFKMFELKEYQADCEL